MRLSTYLYFAALCAAAFGGCDTARKTSSTTVISSSTPSTTAVALPAATPNNAVVDAKAYRLFQPITLNPDTTTLALEDFFTLDSLSLSEIVLQEVPSELDTKLSADGRKILLTVRSKLPPLSTITFKAPGGLRSIVLRRSAKQIVTMRFNPNGTAYKSVQVRGDMNNWIGEKGAMTEQRNGIWEWNAPLNPGNYSYKLVVDGKDILDPDNSQTLANSFGGINSLLIVPLTPADKLPALITLPSSANSIRLGLQRDVDNLVVMWQNQMVRYNDELGRDTTFGCNRIIKVDLPPKAYDMPRSFLRVYAANSFGAGNDLLIPLENGKPLRSASQVTRYDHEAQSMYFMLVDRFYDGKPSNNAPLNDARLTERENFQGGDIVGITKKLKEGYFRDLHINTLWVSPISQQPLEAWQEAMQPRRWYSGYHGYWPISSSKIDTRFGTDAEMHELVDEAHKQNMNVVLDYVAHHVHKLHPLYRAHPDQVTPFILPDGTKNLRIWDAQRLTTWFDDFLPTMNLNNPEVARLQADSAMYWITKFNLDGFRHDATKHIPTDFWRLLTKRMKSDIDRPYYQIGETFGSRELIGSYIGSGMMDAQFDFNLYFDARDVFAKDDEDFTRVANSLTESFNYFGWHSTMGNITGNHDLVRFMGLASGAVGYDEDGKEAGYARKIEVKDSTAYAKLSSLTAFIMTIPGVPIIYYGDEIGMVGAGDPDNRRMMRFDSPNKKEQRTKAIAASLAKLRQNNLALTYGDYIPLKAEQHVLVYARNYFGQAAVVLFNKSDKPRRIEVNLPRYINPRALRGNFGGQPAIDGQFLSINLPPHSFEVLTK